MTEYIGFDPNELVKVGDYTLRFEFDTAQFDAAILTGFDKLEGLFAFMPSVAAIIGQTKNEAANRAITDVINSARSELESQGLGTITGYDVIFGSHNGYSVPTAINVKLHVSKNPWPLIWIIGVIVTALAVTVICIPPARVIIKEGWKSLVDMVGYVPERLVGGTVANIINQMLPYILIAGVGWMVYKGKIKV
jgi:hypothetical protein